MSAKYIYLLPLIALITTGCAHYGNPNIINTFNYIGIQQEEDTILDIYNRAAA